MDEDSLEFAINRFMIASFVTSALLLVFVVISIHQICMGGTGTILHDIPPFYGAGAVVMVGIIFAFVGRNKPTDIDVAYFCSVVMGIIVLEMVTISILLLQLLEG